MFNFVKILFSPYAYNITGTNRFVKSFFYVLSRNRKTEEPSPGRRGPRKRVAKGALTPAMEAEAGTPKHGRQKAFFAG